MPYVVTRGEVHHDGQVYRLGEEPPGERGDLADVEAVGAVAWVEPQEAPAPEPDIAPAPARHKRGGRR